MPTTGWLGTTCSPGREPKNPPVVPLGEQIAVAPLAQFIVEPLPVACDPCIQQSGCADLTTFAGPANADWFALARMNFRRARFHKSSLRTPADLF